MFLTKPRQGFHTDQLADNLFMVLDFLFPRRNQAVDLPLDRLQTADSGFDIIESGQLDPKLLFKAGFTDKRHSVVKAGPLRQGVSDDQTVRQNGYRMIA